MERKLTVKHFRELTTEELWEIYRLRAEVFVVEQNCVYQDVDRYDKVSFHLMLHENGELLAYARVLPQGTVFEEVSIGRVISARRRCGLGTQIVRAALETAQEQFAAEVITIEAQTYARSLYEKAGFMQVSDEFLEDGIWHIKMRWSKGKESETINQP